MLHRKPFPFPVQEYLYLVIETLLRPWLWSLGRVISLFIKTTDDVQHFQNLALVPVFIVICVAWTIPAFFCFVLRCILLQFRMPYCYVYSKASTNVSSLTQRNDSREARQFSVATANLCLLPEFLSKYNNLSQSSRRAKQVGERLIIDQFYYQNMMKMNSNQSLFSRKSSVQSNRCIATHFPGIHFLCLQETWDRDLSKILVKELQKVFPWILYDVGETSLKANVFMLNSGLLFASQFPILEADFKSFSHSCMQCIFASKGLLMVKVDVSKVFDVGPHAVGYVFNANLQSYQGKYKVLDKQLDEILKWTEEFRRKTEGRSDIVKFDVLCGDLNFDNMSPADKELSQHRLFSVYEDIARVKSGEDCDWAIGTEMRQKYLHDSNISTPEGLSQALQDPRLRQQYIVDADIEVSTISNICGSEPQRDREGNILPDNNKTGGRRRIDYILFRKNIPLEVTNYRFITRLSGLTDHLPVVMDFQTD